MTEILLYGIIGDSWDGLDAKTLLPLIMAGDDDLVLRINSPGGLVFEGLAIINAIASSDRKIIVHIDGLAASMASAIAMIGDEIIMADNALMMIHNPMTFADGDAEKLRKTADVLDKVKAQILRLYADQSGLSDDDVSEMMDKETWLSAEEALAKGLITSIGATLKVEACDVSKFGFLRVPNSPVIALGEPPETAGTSKEKKMPENKPDGGGDVTVITNQVDVNKVTSDAIAAERARAAGIRDAVSKAGLEPAFAITMIDDGTSLDAARGKVIDKLAENAPTIQNIGPAKVTTDQREKFVQGAVNAVLMRAGLARMVAQAAQLQGVKLDLDPGEFRGIRNVELARMSLDMAGIVERSYDRDKIVAAALTVRNAISQGTSDFPVILENVMHKVLQAAYAVQADTWSKFCGIGTVSDFRAHNRYLRGTFGTLDAVNEHGEFKNKTIPDAAKESITASTKGNIIALTRQAIVNDDMDAFSGLAVDLGRAAKLSIEVDVYALLALNSGMGPTMNDGNTLFHASHGNIGSAGAPSVTSFDDARVKMASQKDVSNNEYLDIRPAIWLGSVSLGGSARVINASEYDPDTANKLQRPNMVRGLFADIVDTPRLTGTPWFAFADPGQAPAIEVAFLNGEMEPFLDSQEGWRVDGVEWKVRHDYGVGAVNWRSAVRNAGA